jgi:hypothetical protein
MQTELLLLRLSLLFCVAAIQSLEARCIEAGGQKQDRACCKSLLAASIK